ncbi:unnamed protein product, partial [Chrysoparadoxa australica]
MAKKYRVKLSNGRIVGPFVLSQIGELYQKNHLEGKVLVQLFPTGDWKKLNTFPEINKYLEQLVLGQNPEANENTSTDSTVARISLAKLKEAERKKKKEQELEEKKKKLEALEAESQKEEHKEFRFARQEPSMLVDYEELEKKFKTQEDENPKSPEPVVEEEPEEEEDGVEKTVVIKRPKLDQSVDKTQVNPEALKWFKEQEEKKKQEELQKQFEEEKLKEVQEEEENVDFDESTQFIDRGALVNLKREARELEREIKEEEDKKEVAKRLEDDLDDDEYVVEEKPKKKKMSPIVAFAFLVMIWFLFEEEDAPAKFEPKYLRIVQPISLQVADQTKADEAFRNGIQSYRSGTYLGKIQAYAYFLNSIQFKFNNNEALGYLILVSGELFDNVSEANRGKGAEILFKLIKITRSKTYKDVNIAMGTALFYKNNGKINSAINVLEKYLRISQPSLKLLSLYLDLAISQGDLVKARNIMDKLKPLKNKPVEAYLAMSRFYTLDERYGEGESVIIEGLKKFPNSVAILLDYAEYLLRKQDISKYTTVLQQCEKLKHEYSPAYYAKYLENVGILAAFNKNTKQAAAFFRMALMINDTDELRSKLASLEIGGGALAEKLILESKAIDLIKKSRKL